MLTMHLVPSLIAGRITSSRPGTPLKTLMVADVPSSAANTDITLDCVCRPFCSYSATKHASSFALLTPLMVPRIGIQSVAISDTVCQREQDTESDVPQFCM